jgi:hypothetical protein
MKMEKYRVIPRSPFRRRSPVGATLIWLVCLSIAALCGCGQDLPGSPSTDDPAHIVAKIGETAQTLQIAEMVLTVEADDVGVTVADTADVTPDQESVTFGLNVPVGEERLFIIEAKDSAGNVLLRIEEMHSISPDMPPEISITTEMAPALALRITPADTTVTAGSPFELQVMVENALDLFGASFELTVGSGITAIEAIPGSFLGNDVLSFDQPEEGRIAVSIVRKREAGGVNGSGHLATLVLQADATGKVAISFDRPTVTLQNGSGTTVFGMAGINLKSGTVTVVP